MGNPSYGNQGLIKFIRAINDYPMHFRHFLNADDSAESRRSEVEGIDKPKISDEFRQWSRSLDLMRKAEADIESYILDLVKKNMTAKLEVNSD